MSDEPTVDTLSEDIDIVEDYPKNSFTRTTKDPTLLVAKGRFYGETEEERSQAKSDHIFRLSNTVVTVMSKFGDVKVRAVGDQAIACAVKAISRASALCYRKSNVRLNWTIQRQRGNIGELRGSGHVKDVDATVFRLGNFTKEKENE